MSDGRESPPSGVLVSRAALTAAQSAGALALPHETGGILLGFRTPALIVVTRMLVVEDSRSRTHTYLRRRRPAQRALNIVRREAGGAVGYVGEWHTHPADEPASRTDQRSAGAAARDAAGAVALLVVCFSNGQFSNVRSHIAYRAHPGHPLLRFAEVMPAQLEVTDATPESLEVEAATHLTGRNPTP